MYLSMLSGLGQQFRYDSLWIGKRRRLAPEGMLEIAFHDLHLIEKLAVGSEVIAAGPPLEPEQYGGRPDQGHPALRHRLHVNVGVVNVHAGIGLHIACTETYAKTIVVGRVDPGAEMRQLLHSQMKQVDPINGPAFDRN